MYAPLSRFIPSSSPLLSAEENAAADRLVEEGKKMGFIELEGQALAYLPIDFTDGDEWLSHFSASRRKNFRRKFRSRGQLDIDVLPFGDKAFNDENFLSELYEMYMEVFNQSEIHFDCLSPDFFFVKEFSAFLL